jgi:hypothetical protein
LSKKARPGHGRPLLVSSTSIGVTPIQWRCWTFTLPGSSRESAYCGTSGIHQEVSNAIAMRRAREAAHARVSSSPFEAARSARS